MGKSYRYKTTRRSKLVENVDWLHFLQKSGKTFPEVSLPPSFDPGDASQGLFRFVQPAIENYDPLAWKLACELVLMHAPFSTNMTLEEAFEDAMTCVGNRMATGIWRAYAPDTGTKLEALLNPICREEIKRRIVSGNYSSYTVALKDELLKPEKIPRTFLPVGLDVLVASRMVYGNWLLAFQAMGPDGINYALKDAPT